MIHRITFDPVSHSPNSDQFKAVQCHSEEHGLAQIVCIPGINDDRWWNLFVNFLLTHSPEGPVDTTPHDVVYDEVDETGHVKLERYKCLTEGCNGEEIIHRPHLGPGMWEERYRNFTTYEHYCPHPRAAPKKVGRERMVNL